MTRIFVYESVSGEGLAPDDAPLLSAGVSMRDAIVADLLRVAGVAATCAVGPQADAPLPPAAGGHRAALARARDGEAPTAFVRRMAERHDACWIVAPETGDRLGDLQRAVGAPRWIGCSASAIRVASSKQATAAQLAAAGMATPGSYEGAATRWVVKPDDGAGALDTRVHASRDAAAADLQQREREGSSATLEPYVDGEAWSVAMVVGTAAAPAVAFNRQCIEVDADGLVHDRGVRNHAIDPRNDARAPRLHALACDVVRALPGLRGFVGIDLVWHAERGPVVIEVNPRVTCAYVGLSDKLDRNLAADVLAAHAGRRADDAASA